MWTVSVWPYIVSEQHVILKIVSVVSVVVSLNLLNLFTNYLNPSIVSCLIFVSDLSLGKVGAVELYVHYCLVEQLLFFLCEFLGQQLADGSEMKSLAQHRKSKMQHAVVVERQLRYLVDAEPLSLCSIIATLYFLNQRSTARSGKVKGRSP